MQVRPFALPEKALGSKPANGYDLTCRAATGYDSVSVCNLCVGPCVCVYARLDGCIQYRQPPLLPGIVLVVVLAITSVTAAVGRLVLFTAFVVCDWTLGAATGLS